MNNSIREKHDDEMERILEKLESLDPASEEYQKGVKHYEILARLANDDDRNYAEAQIERLKIDAEADELAEKKQEHKKTWWLPILLTSLSTTGSIIIYKMGYKTNYRMLIDVLSYEKDGYAVTTQALKLLQKLPHYKA